MDPLDDDQRNPAIAAYQNQVPLSLPPVTIPQMPSAPPNLGAPQQPNVIPPKGTLQGDKNELGRLKQTGSGESQIASKIEGTNFGQNHPTLGKILGGAAQGIATLGDVGLSAVAPSLAINLPGTAYHHAMLLNQQNRQVNADEANAEKEAQTQNLNLQPQLKQAQAGLAQEKQNEKEENDQGKLKASLASHGFANDEENPGNLRPLKYEEMSEPQQAAFDLKGSQEELAKATSDLKTAQKNNIPSQIALAQQRINGAQQARSIAMERLGLSEKQFEMRAHGTENGQALPGSMINDENQPVGTAFQQNVRPTGQERNKGDMARSADQQLSDIKGILQKHPTLFGPGYGQSSAFKQWLGSEDPDAQRFLAARTIAADHLAGTFGGRSEAALEALDKAIGQFKDNPKAAIAGVDQLREANSLFAKAGAVKTAGSNAAKPKEEAPTPSGKGVSLKDAMALPINKGKSEADVRKDIEAHGHTVNP